jgi:hypothetical protein
MQETLRLGEGAPTLVGMRGVGSFAVAICRLGLVAWATGGLVACAPAGASAPELEGGDGVETGETHGFLRVERTLLAGPDGKQLEGRAAATFLRSVSPEAERPLVAARLVGALLEVPREPGCSPRSQAEPALALRTLSPVDLVPAGELSVTSDEVTTALAARAYPDVAHLVSGIVYTSPDIVHDVQGSSGRLHFHASGSPAVAAFDAEARAPAALELLTVGGTAVDAAEIALPARAESPAADLAIVWTPGEPSLAAGEPGDGEYLEVTTADGAFLRCVPAVPGRVDLPPEVWATAQTGTTNVVLHRVRTQSFQAPGLASGTVQIDTATAVSFHLETTAFSSSSSPAPSIPSPDGG